MNVCGVVLFGIWFDVCGCNDFWSVNFWCLFDVCWFDVGYG